MIKKIWWLVLGGGWTLAVSGLFFFSMARAEYERAAVTLPAHTGKVLFFYRDDCRDCQQIFPLVYGEKILFHSVLFVNLNQVENRKYILPYQLTEVPTLIAEKHRYSGTDRKEILRLFQVQRRKLYGRTNKKRDGTDRKQNEPKDLLLKNNEMGKVIPKMRNSKLDRFDQAENRKYILPYQLTEVPTLIAGKQRYSGTDQKEILRLFQVQRRKLYGRTNKRHDGTDERTRT